ncbi:hypothetical protein [Thermovibrio ammonificans]|jgi:hypothetical protein
MLSSLLSNLKAFFSAYGSWKEPFGNFSFLGSVVQKTVHTTFFMKDYELVNPFYLLGVYADSPPVKGELRRLFNLLKVESRKLLTLPPDHYTSTFALLILPRQEFDISPEELEEFYLRKSLWLGFKGFYRCGLVVFNGREFVAPRKLADVSAFLKGVSGETVT